MWKILWNEPLENFPRQSLQQFRKVCWRISKGIFSGINKVIPRRFFCGTLTKIYFERTACGFLKKYEEDFPKESLEGFQKESLKVLLTKTLKCFWRKPWRNSGEFSRGNSDGTSGETYEVSFWEISEATYARFCKKKSIIFLKKLQKTVSEEIAREIFWICTQKSLKQFLE